jgi:hypothetical protein
MFSASLACSQHKRRLRREIGNEKRREAAAPTAKKKQTATYMYKALTLALLVSLCCSAQTVTINQTVTQGDGTQITVSGSLKLSAVPVDASSVPPSQLLSRFAFPYPNLQTGAPAPANLTGFGSAI